MKKHPILIGLIFLIYILCIAMGSWFVEQTIQLSLELSYQHSISEILRQLLQQTKDDPTMLLLYGLCCLPPIMITYLKTKHSSQTPFLSAVVLTILLTIILRWPISKVHDLTLSITSNQKICPTPTTCTLLNEFDYSTPLNIETAVFNGDHASSIPMAAIKKLTSLKHLTLKNYSVNHLPQDFFQLPIINLTLNNVYIKNTNGLWQDLHQLKTLVIDQGEFRNIPDNLYLIPLLEELIIKNLKLQGPQYLASSVNKAKQLKKLDLQGNNIDLLPESIEEMENLVELHLNHNKLKTITLQWPSNLKVLILSDNKLSEFPEGLTDLMLEHLDISYNTRLFNPPRLIYRNESLKYFNAKGTRMNRIEASIDRAKNLDTLILPDSIEFVSKDLLKLTELTYLEIPYAALIPLEFDQVLPKLKKIVNSAENTEYDQSVVNSWLELTTTQ